MMVIINAHAIGLYRVAYWIWPSWLVGLKHSDQTYGNGPSLGGWGLEGLGSVPLGLFLSRTHIMKS